jgi:myo-inositol-1(or 4)-monophosphatase
MTPENYTPRFDFAERLIREAGAIGKRYFERRSDLTVASKGAQDVVTEADGEIERLIRSRIHEAFPDDSFFGEETGADTFDAESRIWIVDPIDGTQPFVSGMSEWCVSIAFVDAMSLEFGLVFAPVRGELFAGGRQTPATCNGTPISGHPGESLGDGITAVGHSPRVSVESFLPVIEGVLRSGGMYYRSGSGALTLCDVAAGRLVGYVEVQMNSWDCFGAMAVLHASGHHVNDMLASPESILAGGPIAVSRSRAIYDRLAELVGAGPPASG